MVSPMRLWNSFSLIFKLLKDLTFPLPGINKTQLPDAKFQYAAAFFLEFLRFYSADKIKLCFQYFTDSYGYIPVHSETVLLRAL